MINEDAYWMIQKIEKVRKFNFVYNDNVIHKPLHFFDDRLCKRVENPKINKKLSYLKSDKTLNNITYKKYN